MTPTGVSSCQNNKILGDASKARCSSWKGLERDIALGSWVKQEPYETQFFSSAKGDLLAKGYKMIKSFTDHVPSFVPLKIFKGLYQRAYVNHVSLGDLFKLYLNTFDGEKALQGEDTRHLWNIIIYKGSEVRSQLLHKSPVAQYLLPNQLLKHHGLKDSGPLMDARMRAELYVWMRGLQSLCESDERGLHSIWWLPTGGRLFVTGRLLEVLISHNKLGNDLEKSSGFLPLSIGQRSFSCMHL